MSKLQLEHVGTIIFDLGGVILDIDRNNAVQRFKDIGLAQADKLLDSYKQQGVFLQLEEGKISQQEYFDTMRRLIGSEVSNKEIRQAWMGFFPPVIQERLDTIERLRLRHRICLLSNTNPIVMDWALSPQFSPEGKPLNAYFDRMYLSYELGITKPDPEIFRRVIEAEQLQPNTTLFVDDGEANIQSAKSLGFLTLHINEGEDFREYF